MDDPLAAVDLDNLALAALEGTTGDDDLIILADRHGLNLKRKVHKQLMKMVQDSYAMLSTELLGKGGAHDDAALVRGGREVGLAALAARRADS